MNLRQVALISGAGLALVLVVAMQGRIEREVATREALGEPGVDSFMRDFTIAATDASGATAYELRGSRLVQLERDASGQIDDPSVIVFDAEGGPPWRMQAERGWIAPAGAEVLLNGSVQIQRALEARPGELRIETERLTVRPSEETASTDAPLTVTAPRQSLTATGMHLDMPSARLDLHSEVSGRYAP
jgi:LPS export ABC transporter protein LptC